MSDYTPSGDPTDGTTADATELSAEFILIQTAVNSKADETNAVLVTPNIGTPSAGTLTNCTGLPIATGVSGLGSGVATWLATPSSANLAAAVTGETGSGALVFATSPTLTTPDIGTPSAGVLTNCTGTAAGLTAGVASAVAVGGITGMGTGVATFLATPSSANLASAVTGETGSGALVFGTSPTLSGATLSGTTNLSGGQITFPATQSASADANTLDDYEEGSWTPTLVSTGLSFTYTEQSGTYTKVGRQVMLSGYIAIDSKTGATDNAVTVGGNAFVASGVHAGACIIYNMAGTATVYHVRVSSDSTITLLAAATEVAMTGSKLNSSMGFSFSITFCV